MDIDYRYIEVVRNMTSEEMKRYFDGEIIRGDSDYSNCNSTVWDRKCFFDIKNIDLAETWLNRYCLVLEAKKWKLRRGFGRYINPNNELIYVSEYSMEQYGKHNTKFCYWFKQFNKDDRYTEEDFYRMYEREKSIEDEERKETNKIILHALNIF